MDAARIIGGLFGMAERHGQLLTCQHEQRLSLDGYGEGQYGTPTPFQAMWLPERQLIKDVTGQQVFSQGRLVLEGRFSMDATDRITLPDGTQPAILRIDGTADTSGFIAQEVWF